MSSKDIYIYTGRVMGGAIITLETTTNLSPVQRAGIFIDTENVTVTVVPGNLGTRTV